MPLIILSGDGLELPEGEHGFMIPLSDWCDFHQGVLAAALYAASVPIVLHGEVGKPGSALLAEQGRYQLFAVGSEHQPATVDQLMIRDSFVGKFCVIAIPHFGDLSSAIGHAQLAIAGWSVGIGPEAVAELANRPLAAIVH